MSELIVSTSVNEEELAEEIASELLEAGLIRSASIYPKKTMFIWDGQLTIDDEFSVMMKCTEAEYAGIEKYIAQHHPYLVPEVIKTPVSFGSNDYRKMIEQKRQASG